MQMAEDKGARHQNYVDRILIGWEANGYPKSREEKVQGAKSKRNGASKSADALDEYGEREGLAV